MKDTRKYSGLALVPIGIACFLFFYYSCPYHLIHKEQTTLFVYTSEALLSYLDQPAVFSCLAGDFMTQFFRSPLVAAALIATLIYLTGLACYLILSKKIYSWVAAGIAGMVMVWEALRSCGLLYSLSSTFSLLGSYCLFLLYDRIRNKKVRYLSGFAGVIAGYWLFGYGAFIFLLFIHLTSLTNKKDFAWGCLAGVLLLALPLILSKKYLLTYPQAYQYPATSWWDTPNSLYERLLGLDIEGHSCRWEKVRKLTRSDERISACSYYYNLANAAEGLLPERLFNYYQPGLEGLFIPITASSSYISSLYAGEIWYHLGDMTMAEHATILGMIFSPNHKGSRMVKRLAEINLVNGDNEAAMKYLRILSNTLFYKQWAKDRMPGKESEAVKQWLKNKQTFIPQSDTIRTSTVDIVRSLRLLLETNPDNKMARDYLLCFHLLAKDLPSFIKDYVPEAGKAPCRLYAEALMIDLVRRHATGNEIREAIVNPAIVQDFKEYTRLHQQYKGDPAALAGKFSKTYWFYYHYAQNQ